VATKAGRVQQGGPGPRALPPTRAKRDHQRGHVCHRNNNWGPVMTRRGKVSTPTGRAPWPKDALRIVFGLIWLVDAILKWLPGFRANYMDTIMGVSQDQPGWLQPWFRFWIDLQHPRANFFAYLVATIETLIALALIFGFARKVTYISAAVFSLLIWATAEGFGGPYTAGSADIGTALIYALVFSALLALSYYVETSRVTLDYYLERRISWWWMVAELRRPAPAEMSPPREGGGLSETDPCRIVANDGSTVGDGSASDSGPARRA
jgi:thiosulfate dehydrogenase [quinone] large subunit